MLAWLLWQLEKIERIRSAACALMSEFGDAAYAEARRRESAADRGEAAEDWRRVALVVARRTSVRVVLDPASPPPPELSLVDEQSRTLGELHDKGEDAT